MQYLQDFLLFRRLLSPALLVFTYYLGALVLPLLLVYLVHRVRRRFPDLPEGAPAINSPMLAWARRRLAALAWGVFLVGELMWRILFEFLLVYFQMRDLLQQMAGH